MRTKVLGEGGAISEPLAASSALVGPVSRMCPHVSGHRAALRKTAVTDWTFEGFFSAMSAKMSGQVSSLRERLLANGTLVGLLPGMRAKVCLQSGLPGIGLAANVARVVSWERLVSLLQRVVTTSGESRYMYSTGRIVGRIVSYSGRCWIRWRIRRVQGSTVEWVTIRHCCLVKVDDRAMDRGRISKAVSTSWEVVGAGRLIRGESYSR